MPSGTYYCGKCGHNHRHNSQIGRQHASIPTSSRSLPPPSPSGLPHRVRSTPTGSYKSTSPQNRGGVSRGPAAQQPGEHRSPPPRRRREQQDPRKQELRRVLEDGSADVVVSLLFDPRAGYRLVADEILDRMPWYRRRNRRHWLCKILERASEAIDPSTYTAWLGHGIEEILKQSGLPRFAVKVISKSAAFGAGKFVSSTTQLENVKLGLLLIIPLTCPNFSKCPAQAAPCKALLTPGVEDLLRSAASGQQA